MPQVGISEQQLKELEAEVHEARAKYLAFGDPHHPGRLGRHFIPSANSSLGKLQNDMEESFREIMAPVTTGFPDQDFDLLFDHEWNFIPGARSAISLISHVKIVEAGSSNTAALYYWMDQGYPATTFERNTPVLVLKSGHRTEVGKLIMKPEQPDKTDSEGNLQIFSFGPGDTRKPFEGRGWSEAGVKKLKSSFNKFPEIGNWDLIAIAVPFGKGGG